MKNKILELAGQAVAIAEETLAGESGKQKKTAAVKYVVTHLPVPTPIRYVLGVVLSVFIDSAVEIAVAFMKRRKEVEG